MAQASPSTVNPLLRLWRNEDSRGVIIQILTMVVLCALIAAIARNVVINLANVGKEFSFDFLTWPAAYDIGFSPFIEYTNKSTHLRAAVVGLLNTLLVAFWGCILATVLGFILGIMRLSSNWLVSKISYVFVEFVRNVPVLIHILAIYSLVVTLLPSAKKALDVGGGAFFLSNGDPLQTLGQANPERDRADLPGFLDLYSVDRWTGGNRLFDHGCAPLLGYTRPQGF